MNLSFFKGKIIPTRFQRYTVSLEIYILSSSNHHERTCILFKHFEISIFFGFWLLFSIATFTGFLTARACYVVFIDFGGFFKIQNCVFIVTVFNR